MIKSAAKKTLIGTLGAASLLVAGTQVAHADTVKVQSGDTVWAYSQKYHVSIDSIVKANKLADANLIIAGHALNIPGVSTSDASQTSTATQNSNATSTANQAATTTQSSAAASSVASSSAASSSVASSSTAATDTTSAASSTTATATTSAQSSAAQNSSTQSSVAVQEPSTESASSTGNGGLAQALTLIGTKYTWGGNTPAQGFDCSGLVAYVYGSRVNGRTTTSQATTGSHHSDVYNAPAGALVFFDSSNAPYHVGISTGNGSFVHAPQTGETVKVTQMKYYTPSFYVNVR
ncbi:NLP/P60 protein [Paucilactobacillus hokkaidonensis JCM 18461]|uniref:NLP/P60 protein n=2 Tax=Paucilactobacillus hokkaidonensis TaxID=1193095 RepID=A0A0A1GRR2_9LACO|nr:C40 family peptidase [Paucilactobacillus hokkaidonensis]KRO11442.1 NLP P60 protein [Paucilactobacillus hokkaidonensis]BAP85007.1 NLP/P60 protein [Paucilactobacillus hokkaidonensis JCM 18461]